MPIMEGWIKLHRQLLKSLVFTSEKGLKVWVWCLLKANHKEIDCFIGRQKIHLFPGQFVTGKNAAKEELEMAVGTIWYWLNQLSVERNIERKVTNKYSIVTVLRWKQYQETEPKTERRLNADRTQIDQQIEPYNNDKNDKNDKNVNNSINGIVKKQPVCPVLKSPLKEKYPKGHEECVEYLLAIEENRGMKFSNRAKQFMFLHKLLRVNCDFEAMDSIIADIEKKYGKNNWDFSTISNWLDKGGGSYG